MEQLNRNHIALMFWNFDFPPEEITEKLDLQPTMVKIKGERNPEVHPAFQIAKHTYWEYEWKPDSSEFIGDVAARFIAEILEPRKIAIKELGNRSYSEFKIVQYYFEGINPGYHLPVAAMKTLVEANVEMDIDVYCLAGASAE